MLKLLSLILLLLAGQVNTLAQEQRLVWPQPINLDPAWQDSLSSAFKAGSLSEQELVQELQLSGYWLAETHQQDSMLAILPGPRLEWGGFRLGGQKADADLPLPPRGELSAKSLQNYLRSQLQYWEERGYPFAQLQIDEYYLEENKLFGQMSIQLGPLVRLDSVALMGYKKLSPAQLRYDLGLNLQAVYRESNFQALSQRIARLEYLKLAQPPRLAFFEEATTLYLYLEQQGANQIDGVLGLNTEAGGPSRLNGDFQLRLLNSFHRAEDIFLRWRRPDPSVQELKLALHFPFLFNSPLGLRGELSIFRQDSSFSRSEWQLALPYRLSWSSAIEVGVEGRQSSLLQGDGAFSSGSADFQSLFYQVGLNVEKRNRRPVASAGYRWQINGLSGRRQRGEQSQVQYGYRAAAEHYLGLGGQFILKSHGHSALLIGDELLQNEVFRLGGLQSLRGFNEQEFFSSGYLMMGLELRYSLGPSDYLAVFSDLAWTENRNLNGYQRNFLQGLGAGINFSTQGGIFSFFLALGRSEERAYDVQATKVHVGYINQF